MIFLQKNLIHMQLHNKINSEELKEKMANSDEKRVTISFYQYAKVGNPQLFRDHLYLKLDALGVCGRVYVAHEGINAQISVGEDNLEALRTTLNEIDFLQDIRLNIAVDDDGKSFYKLKIQVKKKILADGLNDETFDVTKKGQHVDAEKFNELHDNEETIVIDMRNHYETEVGHFEKAVTPDVDTFRDSLPIIEEMLQPHKEKNVLMYCTGGIRCEKASAYFKHKGFENVYQLEGGIIKYAQDVKKKGLENKFRGKNFVFDERLGERISEEIISNCHQCGKACDTHTNCKNEACNLLFLQCEECATEHEGCCSSECQDIIHLPEEEQKELRKNKDTGIRIFSKGRFNKGGKGELRKL